MSVLNVPQPEFMEDEEIMQDLGLTKHSDVVVFETNQGDIEFQLFFNSNKVCDLLLLWCSYLVINRRTLSFNYSSSQIKFM